MQIYVPSIAIVNPSHAEQEHVQQDKSGTQAYHLKNHFYDRRWF